MPMGRTLALLPGGRRRSMTRKYCRSAAVPEGDAAAFQRAGLEAGRLQAASGGEGGEGACLRVNFYPWCPQPELTLGVAGHSDPGGMTMLLVDDHVKGLQVRSPDGEWIIIDPVPDAFIVNVGDQI